METLFRDLRLAARMLLRSPGFMVVAVLTLALGIGANTAMFSVFDAVLLQRLPYADAHRLGVVWATDRARGQQRDQVSWTDVEDLRAMNHVFDGISVIQNWYPTLSGVEQPERLYSTAVGADYFEIMRGTPLLGRTFTPEEQQDGKDRVVILSYGFWQSHFGGDRSVIGRKITLNTQPYEIVGVMPQDFRSLPLTLVQGAAQLYRPVAETYDNTQRSSRHLRAIARLKPGVTWAQAQDEMSRIGDELGRKYPDKNSSVGVRVTTLQEDTVGTIRPLLRVLLGAVLLVLLIATANVANLLLARSASRQKEVAIRTAVGATRGRLVRQMLTEGILLGILGGIAGVTLAAWGTVSLKVLLSPVLPQLTSLTMNWQVLLFTLAISVASGLVFGVVPALQSFATSPSENLKVGGSRTGSSREHSRLRQIFVVAEMAVALVLLVGAGLLIKSFSRLSGVDPGFEPQNRTAISVWLPSARYSSDESEIRFYRELHARVLRLPGVRSAGLVSTLPLQDFDRRSFELENKTYGPGESEEADSYMVDADYVPTMGIHLIRGRNFDDGDKEGTAPAVLVSETLARNLWPGEEAVGKHIRLRSYRRNGEYPKATVVGVVGDVKQYGLDRPPTQQFYVSSTQFPTSTMVLVVNSPEDAQTVAASVRRVLGGLDRDVAAFRVQPLRELVSDSVASRRVSMIMLSVFAGTAFLLGIVGLYGVISYGVSQRTGEIGIRVALGAERGDVIKLVISQGLRLVGVGILVGVVAALIATRFMSTLLYEVPTTDPGIYLFVAALLTVVAISANYIPALKAAAVDPLEALRIE